jgi:hypothetical protein
MPPRDPELPEGTDHIINGAMETGADSFDAAGTTTADSGFGALETGVGEGLGNQGVTGMSGTEETAGGFVASSGTDDTGGMSAGTGAGGTDAQGIKAQLKDGASGLQAQAGEKIRAFAETGKGRATGALDDLTNMVNDAASQIDERLGAEYGEYARRAADAVSGFADTIRNKEVDELFEDGKNLVRKSPGGALGVAAVVGFTLVRVIKAGLEAPAQGRDVDFEPSPQLTAGTTGTNNIEG